MAQNQHSHQPSTAFAADPSPIAEAKELFLAPPPKMTALEAQSLALRLWGVNGKAHPLDSERDCNFQIETPTEAFTLKISNAAEPANRIHLNTQLLLQLAHRTPDLPVPRVLKTLGNSDHAQIDLPESGRHIVRLLTYLEGQPLNAVPAIEHPVEDLGRALGRLNASLADFQHADKKFDWIWNAATVDQLAEFVACLSSQEERARISQQLEHFTHTVRPKLKTLRHQMIHNDANLGNVLVSAAHPHSIAGIFDFGDIIFAPTITELAVAGSYHIGGTRPISDVLADLVAGYHSAFSLLENEIMVLLDLVTARLLTTILITHWRANIFPDNADYILRHNANAWRGLNTILNCDKAAATAHIRKACGMEI